MATSTLMRACCAPTQRRLVSSRARNLVVAQAERQQQGSGAPAAAPAGRVSDRPPASWASNPPPPHFGNGPVPPEHPMFDDSIEVVQIQRLGEEVVSGVVSVDRGEQPDDLGRIALLAAGDGAALLAFAAIGRISHGEPLAALDVLGTAAPFLLGWYGAATFVGAYAKPAQRCSDPGAAVWTAAHAWAIGIPCGLALRCLLKGYFPDSTFLMVSMAATGVLTIGWRAALAAATPAPKEPQSVREALDSRMDRKGNIFDFFSMIASMTRRW